MTTPIQRILARARVRLACQRFLASLVLTVTVAGLALLALWGLAVGPWDLTPPTGRVHDLGNAWLGVYFAYAGWPAIVYVAGEVRDPGRTLPVAVLGGTALIAVLYGLLPPITAKPRV